MTKDALTTPTSNQTKFDALQHVARQPVVAFLAVVSFLLIVGYVSWVQSSKAASLRRIASEIQLGEIILDVDTRLGKSTYGYGPPAGAPQTKFGAMYGGTVNDFREQFDSLVRRVFRGSPRWYSSQPFRSWPVLVEYDGDKRVTAVFVDGVEITSSMRQRTKR